MEICNGSAAASARVGDVTKGSIGSSGWSEDIPQTRYRGSKLFTTSYREMLQDQLGDARHAAAPPKAYPRPARCRSLVEGCGHSAVALQPGTRHKAQGMVISPMGFLKQILNSNLVVFSKYAFWKHAVFGVRSTWGNKLSRTASWVTNAEKGWSKAAIAEDHFSILPNEKKNQETIDCHTGIRRRIRVARWSLGSYAIPSLRRGSDNGPELDGVARYPQAQMVFKPPSSRTRSYATGFLFFSLLSNDEITGEILTMPGQKDQLRTWWKESAVYQIYPASFQDSNGDGVGDLKGIISRVDYLKELGVDIVWLSPIFKSPQVDMGYDVSDYRAIHPPYGDIADVDTLKDKLHERGMKLVLDLVMNHTSDQHEWFQASRKSKDNPYRDWYIWRPPRYDAHGQRQPPNNWDSHFQGERPSNQPPPPPSQQPPAHTQAAGSAWEYDEATDEYYLRLFAREQPDLNWENPAVRAACYDTTRFWLDRGADGFRLDVINFISKDQRFPDSDRAFAKGTEYYACGPRLHEYLKELGAILQEYDAFSVGEMPCVGDEQELLNAVGADRGELSMIFHFEFMDLDHGAEGKFSPKQMTLGEIRQTLNKWQRFMYDNNGWNALYLENHDQPRAVSRFASDAPEHRAASAKMLAVFMAFQAGTPFIYQGQEIGMTNVPKEWPMDEYQDIDCLNHWNLRKDAADEATKAALKVEYQKKSRDNARTPMQWDGTAHAGFTTGDAKPWMRVHDNYPQVNAAAQVRDASSVYAAYRAVLGERRARKDIFVYGDFAAVDETHDKVLAYRRTAANGDTALVACNFSADAVTWAFEGGTPREVVFSPTGKTTADVDGKVELGPYEAIALLL
ncbi:Alpha amylase [Cordyceps militaris]|uniref:Alpha amylase n=1 Tax=Cordyceps militaris TaxID=73501 RepID=A0A2H4SFT3_CORMI|nr:Alpha amylase [Cordyceps militaris]